jgi:hypothetical protein
LPVPKDHHGKAQIHYTTIYRAFAKWSDDGSLEHAFIASVEHLAHHQQLDLSVLHGDGTNTVAKKGGDGISYSGYKHHKGEKVIAIIDNHGYILAPLPVAPVNEADTVLLPDGLEALKRVAEVTGLNLHRSYLNLDGGFDSRANRKAIFNAGLIPNIPGEPSRPQDDQAWVQAVVQSSNSYVTGSRGADVCVGRQIQTAVATV